MPASLQFSLTTCKGLLPAHYKVTLYYGTMIGKKMQHIMSVRGVTQSERARRLNIRPQSVNQWIRGITSPRGKRLQQIADALDCSIGDLVTPAKSGTSARSRVLQVRSWDNLATRKVPEGTLTINTYQPINLTQSAYALRWEGESMAPKFPDGCMLTVEPAQKPKTNDFVIALVSPKRAPVFKQLIEDAGRQMLKPVNPQYPILPVDGDTEIIGVVVSMTVAL